MKRIIALICAVVLAVCCFAGCSQNEGKFVVGFDKAFPPMGFVDDNGNLVGFDLDLAAEVAKRLNMELVLQPIDWDSKDMELNSGNISCIWNGFTMEGRENDYSFTDPYMNNNQIAVVLKDSPVNTFADLQGKKAAVQKDSSALDALNANESLKNALTEIVETDENLKALMELEAGAVDCVIMDECVARYNIEKKGGNFKVLDEVVGKERFGVGFKKDNTELRDKVQKALEKMAEDGTMAKISTDWFGKDITTLGK